MGRERRVIFCKSLRFDLIFLQGFAENAARLRKQQVILTVSRAETCRVDVSFSGEERELVLTTSAAALSSANIRATSALMAAAVVMSSSSASHAMMPFAASAPCAPAPTEQLQSA